ncbi:MAG TPA: hypothetical protein VNL91_00755 [Thermoanaerobaculia bacterium]|nr:hypothetical protein [Thermoanaerobaculia bacterium]
MAPPVLIIALAALGARTALAQQYGQWSWDASARSSARRYDETLAGASTTNLDQREWQVIFGVRGFLLHPALGSFRAAVETAGTQHLAGVGNSTKRLGYRGDFQILPQSAFPIRLYASRTGHDHAVRPDEPYFAPAIPDTTSTSGGSLRIRKGPLAGLLLSSDRTTIAFAGGTHRPQTFANDHLDWSSISRQFQQHYRIERQVRDLGSYGYRIADLTINADDRLIRPGWEWDMTAVALRRNLTTSGLQAATTDIVRLQNHFTSKPAVHRMWDLSWSAGYTGGSRTEASTQTHDLGARYLSRRLRGWQIVPFAGYGLQISDAATVRSPRAGVGANWAGARAGIDLGFNAAANWLLLQWNVNGEDATQTAMAWSIGASAAHGSEQTLRKEMVASASHNQLRTAGETLSPAPGPGIALAGIGTEQQRQARVTLRRRFGEALLVTAYTDWLSRSSEQTVAALGSFEARNLTQTFQLTGRKTSLLLNTGRTTVRSALEQEIRFVGASAGWRVLRSLSMNANYRSDHRRTLLEPPLDGERFEAGATLQVGAFSIVSQLFRSREQLRTGDERTSDGFNLSISREFGGWLPIVSGPRRRGVVR